MTPLDALSCCVYVPHSQVFKTLAQQPVYGLHHITPHDDWEYMWESDCFEYALYGSEDACMVLHTVKVVLEALKCLDFGHGEEGLEEARDRSLAAILCTPWTSDTLLQLR